MDTALHIPREREREDDQAQAGEFSVKQILRIAKKGRAKEPRRQAIQWNPEGLSPYSLDDPIALAMQLSEDDLRTDIYLNKERIKKLIQEEVKNAIDGAGDIDSVVPPFKKDDMPDMGILSTASVETKLSGDSLIFDEDDEMQEVVKEPVSPNVSNEGEQKEGEVEPKANVEGHEGGDANSEAEEIGDDDLEIIENPKVPDLPVTLKVKAYGADEDLDLVEAREADVELVEFEVKAYGADEDLDLVEAREADVELVEVGVNVVDDELKGDEIDIDLGETPDKPEEEVEAEEGIDVNVEEDEEETMFDGVSITVDEDFQPMVSGMQPGENVPEMNPTELEALFDEPQAADAEKSPEQEVDIFDPSLSKQQMIITAWQNGLEVNGDLESGVWRIEA